jgi:hypothetical protein
MKFWKASEEIAKRWNGGGLSIGASKVELTSEQWAWLGQQKKSGWRQQRGAAAEFSRHQ